MYAIYRAEGIEVAIPFECRMCGKCCEKLSQCVYDPLSGKIIAETAKQKGLPPTAVVSVDNALGAAELLRYNLRQGDVVLVKGSHGLHMDRISKILEGA